jgi:hypothetical protein
MTRTGARKVFRSIAGACAAVVLAASGVLASQVPAVAAPAFQLPFPCGQLWRLNTWDSSHAPALDMVREPQNLTEGSLLVAPAAGRVNQSFLHGNAGNMIQIDHGGGHFTTYIHLQSRAVSVGTQVAQGQTIGRVGHTGETSNGVPHLHYEQGFDSNGDGRASWGFAGAERVTARFNGVAYGPGAGGEWRNVESRNCGQGNGSINGDRFDDIVAVYSSGELVWYPNNGSNNFLSARQLSNAPAFRLMSTGDVNGDGLDDMVAVYNSGELVWYPNNGSDNFLSARQLSNAPAFRLMSTGDVNGDGLDDMVAVYNSGELVWYPNNGSDNFLSARQLSNAPAFRLMSTGDVNGDGLDDIIAVYNSGELVWYPNNGSDNFLSARQLSNAPAFRLMSTGDVNGDGLDDIIAVYNSGELVWYPNNGSDNFLSARQLSNAPAFRLMAL